MSSLVYLLVWSPPPYIPYISLFSSPNECLLFAAHAHSIATCFAVVWIFYHLFLVFLSTPYLELCLLGIDDIIYVQHCSVQKCVIVASIVRDGSSCLDSKIVYIIHFCCWLHENWTSPPRLWDSNREHNARAASGLFCGAAAMLCFSSVHQSIADQRADHLKFCYRQHCTQRKPASI